MSDRESGTGDGQAPPSGTAPLDLPELAWRVLRALPRMERRAIALQLLASDAEELTFRRNGIRWTAFAWDRRVSSVLFETGSFQPHELRAVLAWMDGHGRFTPPRKVIVDLGAHIGTSTIPFAQARADCRVLAIEPVPDIFDLLVRNVTDNGLTGRVTCVRTAIGAGGRDRVEMVLPAHNSGGGEVRRPGRAPSFAGHDRTRAVVDVPVAGLMDVLGAHGVAPEQVAFVWSDTEGCEAEVIESGAPLWAAGVPLFTELRDGPAGVDALRLAATQHFSRFIGAEALKTDGAAAPRHIAELEAVCRALGDRVDDILLLPDGVDLPPRSPAAGGPFRA